MSGDTPFITASFILSAHIVLSTYAHKHITQSNANKYYFVSVSSNAIFTVGSVLHN